MSGTFSLVLPFDTQGEDFARGFEAGRLWAILQERPDEPVEQTIHGTNAEMALRMAESLSRTVQGEELDDTWIAVVYGAQTSAEDAT